MCLEPSSSRKKYLDYLRVFSMFAVMFLHLSGECWYSAEVTSFEWQIFNFYDSLVRWCVPVFIMISGSLFLSRDIEIKTLFSKYILRITLAYFIWNFIYALYGGGTITAILANTIAGASHMWFLPMIAGLYICHPIIKAITSSPHITKYYLIVAFIIVSIIPFLQKIIHLFLGEFFNNLMDLGLGILNNMNLTIFAGYVAYFILGYILDQSELSARQRHILYGLSVIGFAFTIAMTAYLSVKRNSPYGDFYDYTSIGVVFESIGVFVFAKQHLNKESSIYPFIYRLAQYSFGAYLVHMLYLQILWIRLGITTMSFNAILSVPLETLLIFICSIITSAILNRIPIIRRWLV